MADPTYEVGDDGTHRATFPGSSGGYDVTSISFARIRVMSDGEVQAEVYAAVVDQVVNRSRFQLLSDQGAYRFCQAAAASNGSIDWPQRFFWAREQLLARVREPVNDDSDEPQAPDRWPALNKAKALHGVAGKLVLTIDPYTEADPVAVLFNVLCGFGNLLGAGPHFLVEHTKHYLRLFGVLVGDTSKGRKGTSWSTPLFVLTLLDAAWAKVCVTSGLSSGEGLIYQVRDERWEKQPIKQKGRVIDYQLVMVDAGVSDKRLMLVEEEFSQCLKVMSREGNILSQIVRQAWDTGNLHPLIKNNPTVATNAHISITGHISAMELLKHLTEVEMANGYANRFLWLLVRRSKTISDPVGVPLDVLDPLVTELRKVAQVTQTFGAMKRDIDAQAWWETRYEALSEGKPGLLGAIMARSEAQVMRLACIYAALDGTAVINCDHLDAALAVWQYSEDSVRYIFGTTTGDPIADRIMAALRDSGELDLTSISLLFDRNVEARKIRTALDVLERLQMITREVIKAPSRGRPTTIVRRR